MSPTSRDMALMGAMDAWAEQSPEYALDFALQWSGNKNTRESLLIAASRHLTNQDPRTAADNLELFPEGHIRDQVVANITREWFRHNPGEAHNWLVDMPNSPAKSKAIATLVHNVENDDPEYAFGWAATVPDEVIRKNVLSTAAEMWSRYDQEAATEAVYSVGLSARDTEEILRVVDKKDLLQHNSTELFIP